MTRTRTRISAVIASLALVAAGSIVFASPAAATVSITGMLFEVQIGSTWTTIPFGGSNTDPHTNVPVGDHPVRFTVTNNGDEVAVATLLFAGSLDYNGDGVGINKANCPAYDAGTNTGFDGSNVIIPVGATVVCTKTMTFNSGVRGTLYGVNAVNPEVTHGWSFYNQAMYYTGVSYSTQSTAQVTGPSGSYVPITDASLQLFNAGETPQLKFAFTNTGSTATTTAVSYSSTGTASLATACPALATSFTIGPEVGSGECIVNLLPATAGARTVTVTATGSGVFGPVTQSFTFTYAASAASCTTVGAAFDQGDTVTVHCSGFEPGLTVNPVLHSSPLSVGSFSTGTGTFSFTFTIPSTFSPGVHTVVITLGSITLTIVPTFTIAAALAPTGTDATLPLALGGLLVAIGAMLLVYRRRLAGVGRAVRSS